MVVCTILILENNNNNIKRAIDKLKKNIMFLLSLQSTSSSRPRALHLKLPSSSLACRAFLFLFSSTSIGRILFLYILKRD
jgi:hypothetical protein